MAHAPDDGNPLSPRQREILSLRAESKSYREIAALLFISASTVHQTLLNAYVALGVSDVTKASRATGIAAVAKAIRNGWM